MTDLNIHPITPAIGAEVSGIDLSESLDPVEIKKVLQAFLEHRVLFFPEQQLLPDNLVRFATHFGTVGRYPFAEPLPGHPEIISIIKEAEQKTVFGGIWHTDSAYLEKPSLASVLYSKEVPDIGGDTLFANMTLAYRQLDDETKELIRDLRAVHSSNKNEAELRADHLASGPMIAKAKELRQATHPVIRTHPETGELSLYVSPAHTTHFEDQSSAESKPLLDRLFNHAQNDDFKCRHRWKKDTVAIWDNRCVLHYPVNDYAGFRREMLRITIEGDKPA